MKISELTGIQKSHLGWRLDNYTGIGILTINAILRGEKGDDDIVDVFKKAGKSERSAKIQAKKVLKFKLVGIHEYMGSNNDVNTDAKRPREKSE